MLPQDALRGVAFTMSEDGFDEPIYEAENLGFGHIMACYRPELDTREPDMAGGAWDRSSDDDDEWESEGDEEEEVGR